MKITSLFLILFSASLFAQPPSGARMTAIADAGIAIGDIWSLNVNQAGLLDVDSFSLALDHQKLLLDQKIAASKFMMAIPFKQNVLGFGFSRYGFDTYKQHEINFAFGRSFGPKIAVALALHYHQLSIGTYGKTSAYSIDAGLIYKMSPFLSLGAHVSNLNNHSFGENLSFMALPLRIQFGTAYWVSQQLMIAAALEQNSVSQAAFKLGLDYRMIKSLTLRAGVKTNPIRESAGLGLFIKDFKLDLAFISQHSLGFGSQIGLSYEF